MGGIFSTPKAPPPPAPDYEAEERQRRLEDIERRRSDYSAAMRWPRTMPMISAAADGMLVPGP